MAIGIIGGSGLYDIDGLDFGDAHKISTPFGETSSLIQQANYNNTEVMFLARHGLPHQIAPHQINYRANSWALKQLGVNQIIAVNAVGGIGANMGPDVIALPDQIIDYTWGRKHTFSDSTDDDPQHIDFTYPYDQTLRKALAKAFSAQDIPHVYNGVYGCSQGPRLESMAEINRMERDGCDLVGMTGMPEAALARELGIPYASVCLVVNWAAGKSDSLITMAEIEAVMAKGMNKVRQGLLNFLQAV